MKTGETGKQSIHFSQEINAEKDEKTHSIITTECSHVCLFVVHFIYIAFKNNALNHFKYPSIFVKLEVNPAFFSIYDKENLNSLKIPWDIRKW